MMRMRTLEQESRMVLHVIVVEHRPSTPLEEERRIGFPKRSSLVDDQGRS